MAYSSDDRLAKLLLAMIRGTASGKITWNKSSIEGVYTASIADFIVQLSTRKRATSIPDYIVTLFDQNGEKVESFADTDLEEVHISGYNGAFDAMATLYKFAAQQANGADEAIDAILRELGS